MRKNQRHSSKLAASLGLLVVALASLPVQAEEQRVAALSRPTLATPAMIGGEIATAATREHKATKPAAAKPAAVKPTAQKDIYERELWRHQSAS